MRNAFGILQNHAQGFDRLLGMSLRQIEPAKQKASLVPLRRDLRFRLAQETIGAQQGHPARAIAGLRPALPGCSIAGYSPATGERASPDLFVRAHATPRTAQKSPQGARRTFHPPQPARKAGARPPNDRGRPAPGRARTSFRRRSLGPASAKRSSASVNRSARTSASASFRRAINCSGAGGFCARKARKRSIATSGTPSSSGATAFCSGSVWPRPDRLA